MTGSAVVLGNHSKPDVSSWKHSSRLLPLLSECTTSSLYQLCIKKKALLGSQITINMNYINMSQLIKKMIKKYFPLGIQ